MNSARKVQLLSRIMARHLSKTASKNEKVVEVVNPKFGKFKELQKQYSVDNGIPSYLMCGKKDKFLFTLTLVLTAVGLGMSAEVLYSLSFPKKD